MKSKCTIALIALSGLLFAAPSLADRQYNRSYENAIPSQSYGSQPYQEPSYIEYNRANRQMMESSGQRLHDAAIDFMQRAQSGQLPPEQRRMFEEVQGQANDLMRRLQNGQLTPQERAIYEQTQRMMRQPLSY